MTERHTSVYLSGGPLSGQPHGDIWQRNRLALVLAALTAIQLGAVHLDVASARQATGSGLGLRNLAVVAILPTVLGGLALRAVPDLRSFSRLGLLFAALLTYASVATSWSQYPEAAIKQVAYLWSYGCLFLTSRSLAILCRSAPVLGGAWCAAVGVLLASLQVLSFDNVFGAVAHRFTSFVSPQSFGLSLAVSFGLLLYGSRKRLVDARIVTPVAAVVAVAALLNGGRQSFLTIVLLAVASLVPMNGHTTRQAAILPLALLLATAALTLGLRTAGPAPLRTLAQEHHAIDLLSFTSSSLDKSGDSGTFRDRLKIYSALARRIADSTPSELLFGHGTSAAAVVIAADDVQYRGYDADTMDPNRTAHNEFLRSLYEWGLVGFCLFTSLVGTVLWTAWSTLKRQRTSGDLLLFATAAVALLGYSTFENVLAATSGPLGASLMLLCAEVYARKSDVAA